MCIPSGLSSSGFPTKTLHTTLLSLTCYMSLPSHYYRCYHSKKTWVRCTDHYAYRHVVSSTPLLSPLGTNILLSTLFPNALSLRSSLNVSDKVSHTCKKEKVTVLLILWCVFLNNKLEDKIICNESNNPYPTAFPYGNGMFLHFYQQQESNTTKTVHKVINKRLKAYA